MSFSDVATPLMIENNTNAISSMAASVEKLAKDIDQIPMLYRSQYLMQFSLTGISAEEFMIKEGLVDDGAITLEAQERKEKERRNDEILEGGELRYDMEKVKLKEEYNRIMQYAHFTNDNIGEVNAYIEKAGGWENLEEEEQKEILEKSIDSVQAGKVPFSALDSGLKADVKDRLLERLDRMNLDDTTKLELQEALENNDEKKIGELIQSNSEIASRAKQQEELTNQTQANKEQNQGNEPINPYEEAQKVADTMPQVKVEEVNLTVSATPPLEGLPKPSSPEVG